MKINIYTNILLILVISLVAACDIKKNKDVDPEGEFLKIFDNKSFSESYIPLDIKQTSDGGYVILAKQRTTTSAFYGIYLLKIDKDGNFVNERHVQEEMVSPGNNLMQKGNDLYFSCMNGTIFETMIVKIDEDIRIKKTSTFPGILYPLSCSQESSGNFIVQSYDIENKKTIVSKISESGTLLDSSVFEIGVGDFNVEEPVMDHLTGTGKALPFLSGSVENGIYFFNGFYNYTLSMVFFSFGSNTGPGLLEGYRDEKCINSAFYNSETNKFALSGYAYGNTTLYPSAKVNYSSGSLTANTALDGFKIPEFTPDSKITLKKETLKGKSTLIYGGNTRSGQIVLYFYDATTGGLLASKHLGYSNTFELGNVIKTSDDGLAVAGVTYLSGRFPRLCLFKISKEELENLLP